MTTNTKPKPQAWQHRAGRLAPPPGHPYYWLIGALFTLAIIKAIVEGIIGHPLF